MPIDAIALLRIPVANATVPGPVKVQPLSDAVLVHTGLPFAEEPEVLTSALRALLGDDLLDEHEDERGIFFLPDVAAPTARSYDALIEEVGEGGVWGPLPSELVAASGGDLGALLGGMLGQLPSGLLAQATAALQQNPGALHAATAQLQGMRPEDLKAMAGAASAQLKGMQPEDLKAMTGAQLKGMRPEDLEAMAGAARSQLPGLQDLLAGSGIDLGSPELREMAEKMQAELQRDPARLARLAEQLFAAQKGDADEDDEE